ncbi:hypothetical protein H7X87_02645 [Acetobacteraceae bacterium]|nr:hypothetical protein [Candidatus Parcubacteria bacterium]
MAKKNSNTGAAVGVGVGVAAAAAAAAGAYWLYGAKDAAKHRRQARSWMLKARAEVLEGVEKLQDIDKAKYMGIVQGVMKRYAGVAGTSAGELKQVAKDLRDSWAHMQAAQQKGARAAKTGRKVGKKVAKRVKRKVSKK